MSQFGTILVEILCLQVICTVIGINSFDSATETIALDGIELEVEVVLHLELRKVVRAKVPLRYDSDEH